MKKLLLLILIVFFVSTSIFSIKQFYLQSVNLDELLEKGEYPEIKGRTPNFSTDIKTSRSTTHVISYLLADLLPKEKFHSEAGKAVIDYVEKIAEEKNSYTFNPFLNKTTEIEVRLSPRGKALRENFVFLVPDKFILPTKLLKSEQNYPTLSDSINSGRTFFWTRFADKGSITIMRFSESNTWKYGLPPAIPPGISPLQQLNEGFNIEIWKRSVSPILVNDHNHNYDEYAFESIWNTFGQLVVAKQENVSILLMKQRLNNSTLSREKDMRYYPFDQKAQAIYENAPTDPIIR